MKLGWVVPQVATILEGISAPLSSWRVFFLISNIFSNLEIKMNFIETTQNPSVEKNLHRHAHLVGK